MSQLTLKNTTSYIAQFVVKKGDQIIARLPGIEQGASIGIPTTDTYQVTAQTMFAGNTYTSAPIDVTSGMGFLAQALQVRLQGTYEFDVQESPNPQPSQLSFQKTCINPVTFTIEKDGKALQSIVVTDSFQEKTLKIGDTFSIYAVVNGVTLGTLTTTNPTATITAEDNSTKINAGAFTLTES